RRRERVVGREQRNVAAQPVEDDREVIRNWEGRESGDHVNPPCARQNIHRPGEDRGVEAGDGVMHVLPIAAQRGAETRALEGTGEVSFADGVGGGGELAAEEFSHSLLQIRKAVEAEPIGEAHDGRGIDVELRGHLIDRGERHRVRVRDDVFGDALLRLREPVIAAPQLLDDIAGADGAGGGLLGFGDGHHALPSAAQTVGRALKCNEAPNACNKIRCRQRRGEAAGRYVGGQPSDGAPASFGRPNAASISRRTFTASAFSSQSTSLQRKHWPSATPRFSLTSWANPSGRSPPASRRRARTLLPPTQN